MMNASETGDLGDERNGAYLKSIVTINCVLNAPLMIVTVSGNSLVLAAILRTPSLLSPPTVFLCNLAGSDLLVGLLVQPVFIAWLFKPSGALWQAYNMLSLCVCGVSLFTMTAIGVDRFLALQYHMRYPNLMTKKRALYAISTIWFICLLFSCLRFVGQKLQHYSIVVGVALSIFVSTFSYIAIYQIVRRHQLQIQAQQQSVQSLNAEQSLNMEQSKKSAINTFIYYICLILCYSPQFTSVLRILAVSDKRWAIAWTFTDTVVFMNSSINPFLYCWRTCELRAAVLKTIRTVLLGQTEGS